MEGGDEDAAAAAAEADEGEEDEEEDEDEEEAIPGLVTEERVAPEPMAAAAAPAAVAASTVRGLVGPAEAELDPATPDQVAKRRQTAERHALLSAVMEQLPGVLSEPVWATKTQREQVNECLERYIAAGKPRFWGSGGHLAFTRRRTVVDSILAIHYEDALEQTRARAAAAPASAASSQVTPGPRAVDDA
ncbi:MAG: hypothetical protein GY772_21650 [bacterium]|nr:hypothetical protein [bacterium]